MNTTSTSPLNMDKLTSALWKDREEYIMFRIAKRVTELTKTLTEKGRPPLKMSIGAPTVAPPKEVTEILKLYLDDPELNTYSVPRGEPFFREAVAQRMQRRFGVSIDAGKEVCSLIGSKEGLPQILTRKNRILS
jgi:LL-diaminopimelate aminotransferase